MPSPPLWQPCGGGGEGQKPQQIRTFLSFWPTVLHFSCAFSANQAVTKILEIKMSKENELYKCFFYLKTEGTKIVLSTPTLDPTLYNQSLEVICIPLT